MTIRQFAKFNSSPKFVVIRYLPVSILVIKQKFVSYAVSQLKGLQSQKISYKITNNIQEPH